MIARASLLLITLLPLISFAFFPTVHAQDYSELPPELEARAQHLYVSIMCPQCNGQTIQQSHAPIATTMRSIIRERLLDDDTDEEIIDRLVEAYGDGVLASPPKRGVALTVWLIPPMALLLGALALFLAVRGLRKGAVAQSSTGLAPRQASAGDLEPYLSMVDDEMEKA